MNSKSELKRWGANICQGVSTEQLQLGVRLPHVDSNLPVTR